MKRVLFAVASCVVAAVLLAGCSGTSDSMAGKDAMMKDGGMTQSDSMMKDGMASGMAMDGKMSGGKMADGGMMKDNTMKPEAAMKDDAKMMKDAK